jgi:RNA polymerase sigma-70 factor (ECF subfamily)
MGIGNELLVGGPAAGGASVLGRRKLEPSDIDLLRDAAGGDQPAFHTLVDRHASGLYRLARSLSATEHDAEDVLQETLMAALRGAASFDGRASVKTWLARILMRQAARAWNRERRSRAALPLDMCEPQAPSGGTVLAVDRRIDLATVLAQLPEDHRQILVLREVEQLSYAEIARVLDVPIGTVDSRLHRARREMRARLEEYAT